MGKIKTFKQLIIENFHQSLSEDRFVFIQGKKVKEPKSKDFIVDQGAYLRCTNFALEAFGIIEKSCIYTGIDAINSIEKAGFKTIPINIVANELYLFKKFKTRIGHKFSDGKTYWFDMKALSKHPIISKFKENMTVNQFGKLVGNKGKY